MSNESRELEQLCAAGVVLVRPSMAALGEMAIAASAAAHPDPPTRLAVARITGAVAGLGPRLSASAVPAGCQVADERRTGADHACIAPANGIRTEIRR